MRALIVEDDGHIARFVKKGLEENHFVVDIATDGEEGEFLARGGPYDVIVLDLMLPRRGGLDVLKSLRAHGVNTPVICVTALDQTPDKIRGLDLGADDYLTKPFSFSELLARVRAVLRRPRELQPDVLRCADLELDTMAHAVRRGAREIELTATEFRLLEFFLRNNGRVLTRTAIGENVWDMNFESFSNVIDVFVSRLRTRIEAGNQPRLIHTIKGVGYALREPE